VKNEAAPQRKTLWVSLDRVDVVIDGMTGGGRSGLGGPEDVELFFEVGEILVAGGEGGFAMGGEGGVWKSLPPLGVPN
jgi:hypothetical protein